MNPSHRARTSFGFTSTILEKMRFMLIAAATVGRSEASPPNCVALAFA